MQLGTRFFILYLHTMFSKNQPLYMETICNKIYYENSLLVSIKMIPELTFDRADMTMTK